MSKERELASSKTVRVKLNRDGAMCCIPVPFDPQAVFGKLRVPVKVTLNGHSYRSTIFKMDGLCFIPLRRSHREAPGSKAMRGSPSPSPWMKPSVT